jgi:hypothetical protein
MVWGIPQEREERCDTMHHASTRDAPCPKILSTNMTMMLIYSVGFAP